MTKKYSWLECRNCSSNFDAAVTMCPVCFADSVSGENSVVELSDAARSLINGYGGVWVGLLRIPYSTDFLVCCEVGIFRFGSDKGVVWDSGIAGLLQEVKFHGTTLIVNGLEWRIDTGESA